ncbi:sensor histidine kinase [Halomonas sp. MA07-2]|uniref:sensor histidine kinase n=1 Tax=Halomonas sp. MA07-2 TaxID=3440841 RepID=UPI003EECFECC
MTWLLHGILLNNLARDFLGSRLQQEAEHVLHHFPQGHLSPSLWLDATGPAAQVFHHIYVLRLNNEVTTSHPLWLAPLAPLLDGEDETLVEVAWQGRQLLLYRKEFTLEERNGVLLIGEDFAPVAAGLVKLHWWVGGIAGVLLLLLIVLNLVAVNRGLRPLSRLQQQLVELQLGGRKRLHLDMPAELDELVEQLNRILDSQDQRLKRSREAVANLSHALKTPLSAVTQVLRGSRPIDDQRRGKMLLRLEDIQAQLEAELRRSRIAGPYTGQQTLIRHEAEQLIEMFSALYPDKCFRFEAVPDADTRLNIERQDFQEMLGIALDNAGKWAVQQVRCHLILEAVLTVTIEDDGPGVPQDDIAWLGRRGMRLDEGRPGHGLGLSILRQLVTHYEGELRFGVSDAGGLAVTITLPGGQPG